MLVRDVLIPIGTVRILADGRGILAMQIQDGVAPAPAMEGEADAVGHADRAAAWVAAYLGRASAPLPALVPTGTPFQRAAWEACSRIPFGEMRSYADIAKAIGRPTAYRAVANALSRNPWWLIVPCHRVVGSDGIGGYAGGIEKKEWLLAHERNA